MEFVDLRELLKSLESVREWYITTPLTGRIRVTSREGIRHITNRFVVVYVSFNKQCVELIHVRWSTHFELNRLISCGKRELGYRCAIVHYALEEHELEPFYIEYQHAMGEFREVSGKHLDGYIRGCAFAKEQTNVDDEQHGV